MSQNSLHCQTKIMPVMAVTPISFLMHKILWQFINFMRSGRSDIQCKLEFFCLIQCSFIFSKFGKRWYFLCILIHFDKSFEKRCTGTNTAQKMKFFITDFFSNCAQIRKKLQIWSYLLKKPLMENFILCAVKSVAKIYKRHLWNCLQLMLKEM